MTIEELEKWLLELKTAKRQASEITRIEGTKLIFKATDYLFKEGTGLNTNAKIDFALKIIHFYDNMEKKIELVIQHVQIEIEEQNKKTEN